MGRRDVVRLVFMVMCGCADAGAPATPDESDEATSGTGREESLAPDEAGADADVRDAALTRDASLAVEPDGGAPAAADGAVQDASGVDAGRADAGVADASACDMLTYASFAKGFVDQYCVGCHGASSRSLSLDTLEELQANDDALALAVVVNQTMPKGTKRPTSEERARFGAWLACGAF